MRALSVRVGVALGINAAALAIAAAVLDQMTIGTVSFVVAVVVFTLVSLVVPSGTRALVRRHAAPISWAADLIATYLALLVTDLVSDGLQIEGVGTWILATLIVWGTHVLLDALFGPRREPAGKRA